MEPSFRPGPGRLRFGLAALSAATLLFELSLTRLSSVLLWSALTPVVIAASLAAVGLGASWTCRRLERGTEPDRVLAETAAWAGPAFLLALAVCVRSAAGFYLCVFALPFALFGSFAGAAYGRLGRPALAYAADLLGGAVGAAAAPLLMSRWSAAETGMVAAAVAGVAGLALGRLRTEGPAWPWWRLAPLVPLAVLGARLASPGPILAIDPYADFGFQTHLVRQTKEKGGRVVATAHDLWARTDLVETDEPWVRYLFTDRMYTARIVRWDGSSATLPDAEARRLARLKGLPFRVLAPESVLVLGSGGGFDVALALQGGARRVDAVEINAPMVRFTRGLGGFAGHVYDRPAVRVHTEEARRFVRTARGAWDLVDLSLIETDPAADRTNTGYQSWVLTAEALGEYLDRLNPGGAVAVVQNVEPLAERTVTTALSTFARRGLSRRDAFDRLAVLALARHERGPFSRLVLVGRDPFAEAASERLLAAATEAGVEAQWLPHLVGREPYRSLADGSTSVDAWVHQSAYRIGAATDDRPFFYDVNRALPFLFVLTGGASALLLAIVFLREAGSAAGAPIAGLGAAALLGVGFMTAESVLIARGQFLLGGPAVAVPLVLGGMLVFAGLGSLGAGVLRRSPGATLGVAGAAVAVLCVAEAWLWPLGVAAARGATTPRLVIGVAAMVGALGLPAGFCFPSCLARWGRERASAAASLYAANALAAVLGASLATLTSMALGLAPALALGGGAYALAALVGLARDPR